MNPVQDVGSGDAGAERGPPSNAQTAYVAIKARILGNVYGPGATVSVQELAQELGMSRTPIRDALIRLEKEQLVALAPRHGFRVLPMLAEEMLSIYEILAGLEASAIELLIDRGLDERGRDRLRGSVEALEHALADNDLETWADADAAFHRALIELAGNRRLLATVNQFWDQTTRARAITLRLRPRPQKSTESHRGLIEAIIARDAPTAREIHWSQRLRSARELADILAKLNLRHL